MTNSRLAVLLTNIGTPDSHTPRDVKKYLAEFLSDPRVIRFPKILWQPILRGFILPRRAKSSAELYRKVWTEAGSPLFVNMQHLTNKLNADLQKDDIDVFLGMRYGSPSIANAFEAIRQKNISHVIILPLFPQYSTTTTESSFDAVNKITKDSNFSCKQISSYAEDHNYINALANSIKNFWQTHPQQHLLLSFHGIPQMYVDAGDPYAEQCYRTAKLLTDKLNLSATQWDISFQSRLGPTKWLKPYTDKVLQELPSRNIFSVDVVCPGFAVDCLETLEEIAIRGKEQFIEACGKNYHYIPALNDSDDHVIALANLIRQVRDA